ncbi:MAG: aldehyde dehydrogenase family protein [Gammaproteobacteria bacterium]|nr:aldehyde dehydrogenase family protein [Gammaproteobacteria bacterium]
MSTDSDEREILKLVENARFAQLQVNSYTQEQVDELVTSIAWSVIKNREELARMAVDEGEFGNYADKVAKIYNRVIGTLADMRSIKTVGVVEEDPETGITKLAKPVGVIGALIPATGPDATPPVKALGAIKARNGLVIAPHPRTKRSSARVVECIREGCARVGAPEDLAQVITSPSIQKTKVLMENVDLIVATGGMSMVKAAYSSGKPAYGVGVGNAVHIVDETADLDDAADMIAKAKTFDFATSCLADNAIVVHQDIYKVLVNKLIELGGHLCNKADKNSLEKVMWPKDAHIPSPEIIAKSAESIAKKAQIDIQPGKSFLLVEETGIGEDHPFSGEKLSVVLAVYQYSGKIENAVDVVNRITNYQGLGHTCGIHSQSEANINYVALNTKTARVIVNQNLNEGAGSPRNGLPYTLSLSCGTWGGNITTENVNVRNFMNVTWVSRPVHPRAFNEEELFENYWNKYGK